MPLASVVFYTLWERCRVTKLIAWECPHSMVLQCFTHFERMLGNNVDSLGEPPVNVSIMIPHFEKMPSNKADFLGVPTCNASIVFHKLWERCRVTILIPWKILGVPTFSVPIALLHALRELPGNKVDSLGVPTFNISVVFYTLWRMPGSISDAPGVPTFNDSILCYMLWEDAGQQLDSLGVATFIMFYKIRVDAR